MRNIFSFYKKSCSTVFLQLGSVLDLEIAASVYNFPNEEQDEVEVEPTMQEKPIRRTVTAIDKFCVWDCCWSWLEIQKFVSLVVFDPLFELFILLCIIANTFFMALDHHNMNGELKRVLKSGHYVRASAEFKSVDGHSKKFQFFVATFAIEVTMKILVMSPKFYFQVGWNIFDFIITASSLLELPFEGEPGLCVLRSFTMVSIDLPFCFCFTKFFSLNLASNIQTCKILENIELIA